jgi:replicative DNA helicase
VAARPGIGKTTFAEHVAVNWSEHGPVLFASLEMSLTQLMDRNVSRRSRIPTQRVIRAQMSSEEKELARDTVDSIRAQQVWYLDDGRTTTATLRAAAAKVKLLSGLSAIVVDYIQLMADPGDNDNQRVGKISRNLKSIAREFDVPLMALSQLNRGSENREDRKPRLSDLRDSGAIEQDADVVLGLYRPRLDSNDLDISLLKVRQGHTGEVRLYFDSDIVALS